MTIYELIQKIQPISYIPASIVIASESSEINSDNNKSFREYAVGFSTGEYSEDIDLLVEKLKILLSNE